MKTPSLFLAIFCCAITPYAQWSLKISLPFGESFSLLASPSDSIAWAATSGQHFYITTDAGKHFSKITPAGITANARFINLFAFNGKTALLAVNTSFTGIGPGILYRTADSGKNWQQVFSHEGNCSFFIDMANNSSGLMACSFDSFNGSVKAGKALYKTTDGGKTWSSDDLTAPGTDTRILGLEVISRNAWLLDGSFIYSSKNFGQTWRKEKLPFTDVYYNNLQVISDDYAIVNESALINLVIKRPGSEGWQVLGNPTGTIGGALECMVLDGNECLFAMPADFTVNFYSKDSAKTFSQVRVDRNNAFAVLEKSERGSNIWAASFFLNSNLWLYERKGETVLNSKRKVQQSVIENSIQ